MQRLCIALLFALCAGITFAQQSSNESPDETAVWKLEFSYWNDIKARGGSVPDDPQDGKP